MTVVTVSPAFTCSATVPPHPKSSSSGCAAITSTRLGTRPLLRRWEIAFRDQLVRGGAVACLRPLDGPRKQVREETGAVGQAEGAAQPRRGEPRQRRTQPGRGAGGGGRRRETPLAPVGGVLAQPFAIVGERA